MILDASGRERLNNGVNLTERQQAKAMAQPATIGDVNDIAHQHAVKATNHLGNQIPALIHHIVSTAIQGYHASLIVRGIIPQETPMTAPTVDEHAAHTTPMKVFVTAEEAEAIATRVVEAAFASRATPGKLELLPGAPAEEEDAGTSDSEDEEGLPSLPDMPAHLALLTSVEDVKALRKTDKRKGAKPLYKARIAELEA